MEGILSTLNSTTDLLGAGGVFDGAYEEVLHYANVVVSIKADAPSAVDGIQVLWSCSGLDDDFDNDVYTLPVAGGEVFTFPILAQYFKVKYTNGATLQGEFEIQTIFRYAPSDLRYRRLGDAMPPDTQGVVSLAFPKPAVSGGVKVSRNLDTGPTGTVAKNSGGQVYGYYFSNSHASQPRFLKLYNKATAPTQADTPVMTLRLPFDSAGHVPWDKGIDEFPLGIGYRATTGFADADTGAPGANEVIVNLMYF